MPIQKTLIEHLLYPAMERIKGNRTRAYLDELLQTQRLPPEKLHALQGARLQTLLRTCIASVSAYRGLGITEADIERDPWAALRAVPILTKAAFQRAPAQYCNTQYDPAQRIPNVTGGSTGEPVRFYMDRYTVEHYEAARWRGLSWYGITPGSRSVMLWGNPIELHKNQQFTSRCKDRLLKNRAILSAYDLSTDKTAYYVRFLNRYRPEYLYGYATALDAFAQLLEPVRDQLRVQLKAVVSTSETLDDAQRARLKAVFGCTVVVEYGARDAGILAYECPHGHLHLSAENVLMEIVDPITWQPVAPGQSGLVVTTDLHNLAMPRLRYLLGDTATLSPEASCPCGVTLPMLHSLDGREDALFLLPNGKLVHGHVANQLVRKYSAIRQFQLVQTDVRHAELRLVPGDGFDAAQAEAFRQDIATFLPGVAICAVTVPRIEPGRSGKVRCSIRAFDLPDVQTRRS